MTMAKNDGDGRCVFGLCAVTTFVYLTAVFNAIFFPLFFFIPSIVCIYMNCNASITGGVVIMSLIIPLFFALTYFTFKYNNYLTKATQQHNIKYIKNWIMFHLLLYIISSSSLCFFGFTYSSKMLVSLAVGLFIVGFFQIHLVKRFYNSEIEYLIDVEYFTSDSRLY